MSDTRSGERLRKLPRIKYTEPDDEDLDAVLGECNEKALVNASTPTEEDLDNCSDEDFIPDAIKKALEPKNGNGKKKIDNKRKNKRNIFRFTDLPAELRNMIYGLCLSRKYPIFLKAADYQRGATLWYGNWPGLNVNLLLVNKSMYAEAGPVLYKNEFSFSDPRAMYHFLWPLSSTTKCWIESITLGKNRYLSGCRGASRGWICPAFNALIGTKNLKSVMIEICKFHDSHLPAWSAEQAQTKRKITRRVCNEMGHWIEAVDKEKGRETAALDLVHLTDHHKKPGKNAAAEGEGPRRILASRTLCGYMHPDGEGWYWRE